MNSLSNAMREEGTHHPRLENISFSLLSGDRPATFEKVMVSSACFLLSDDSEQDTQADPGWHVACIKTKRGLFEATEIWDLLATAA